MRTLIAFAGLAAVLVALAAVTLTSGTEPDPDTAKQRAEKQRVAIVTKGVNNTSGSGDFVLTPLEGGAVTRDSGTDSAVWSDRDVIRDGQSVSITDGVETLEGKRGSLKIRFRIEWVEAGNGYHGGTGTWKVVRGTGQYAQVAGGGRGGHMWLDRGRRPWGGRNEGFLTLPRAPSAKVTFDREAGVGFGLEGRVLTVSVHPTAPSKTRNRVGGARIRATCGQGFTGGQGDPRQERTRHWGVGNDQLRFRFSRDISRIARWCRLEDPVVGHVAFVEFREATLSPKQRVTRIGNSWARLFAAADPSSCQYAGQPLCERLACKRPGNEPIRNCTRPSAEFRDSFRDATVEEIAFRGDRAAARFSNGEAIELGEDVSGFEHPGVWWWISKVGGNAGRKFFR